MPSNFSLHIDPADVLGVAHDATLQDIRDAYRAKAKRYHPDAGGEEWAFRALAQAYEILSTARVVRATHRESEPAPPTAPPPPPFAQAPPHAHPGATFHTADTSESVRPGIHEPAINPAQVVDVEKFSIRYQAEHIWLINDRSGEHRFLSCCLNINWPDPKLPTPPQQIEGYERILRDLGAVFDALCAETQANCSRSVVVDNRFSGWVSYASGDRATAAFARLREKLHDIGLVVSQWSRDLVIPRNWR